MHYSSQISSMTSTLDTLTDLAWQDAEHVAHAAAVEVRELTELSDFLAASRVFGNVWSTPAGAEPADVPLMAALAHSGAYVAGAFYSSQLVGASIGFFTSPLGHGLHSHVTGVEATFTGSGIGAALKIHQRAWCLERGLDTITWTFDPLMSRNAYFNLIRLGIEITDYLPDFYGPMTDGVNDGQHTDRLFARWNLLEPRSPSTTAPATAVLVVSDGEPQLCATSSPSVAAWLPLDIDRIRTEEPARALRWRYAMRTVLTKHLDTGWEIAGFDRAGSYILTKKGIHEHH